MQTAAVEFLHQHPDIAAALVASDQILRAVRFEAEFRGQTISRILIVRDGTNDIPMRVANMREAGCVDIRFHEVSKSEALEVV